MADKTKKLETLDSSYYSRGGRGYHEQMEEYMGKGEAKPPQRKGESYESSMEKGPMKKYTVPRKKGETLEAYRKRIED